MKKSTVLHTRGPSPAPLQILYVNRGDREESSTTGWHQHPHYQVELVFEGRVVLEHPGGRLSLERGDGVLIPVGCTHQLNYPGGPCRYFSAKYTVKAATAPEPPVPRIVPLGTFQHAFLSLLETALRDEAHSAMGETVVAGLVAILHGLAGVEEGSAKDRSLSAQVRKLVERRGGRPVSIPEVAAALGKSPGHLGFLFRKDHGTTLKAHVDRCRARMVGEALRFRDGSITVIARDLGFTDVLSFSHFCRKNLGAGPRALRVKWMKSGDGEAGR